MKTFQYHDDVKKGKTLHVNPRQHVYHHSPTIWPLTVSLSLGLSLFKSSLWSVEREEEGAEEKCQRTFREQYTLRSKSIHQKLLFEGFLQFSLKYSSFFIQAPSIFKAFCKLNQLCSDVCIIKQKTNSIQYFADLTFVRRHI